MRDDVGSGAFHLGGKLTNQLKAEWKLGHASTSKVVRAATNGRAYTTLQCRPNKSLWSNGRGMEILLNDQHSYFAMIIDPYVSKPDMTNRCLSHGDITKMNIRAGYVWYSIHPHMN